MSLSASFLSLLMLLQSFLHNQASKTVVDGIAIFEKAFYLTIQCLCLPAREATSVLYANRPATRATPGARRYVPVQENSRQFGTREFSTFWVVLEKSTGTCTYRKRSGVLSHSGSFACGL